ncbi:DUF2797 domain-containing protein [Candidatus Saccharibacteria bacterium]|nr:DUF2797 domain-containing protein [Candidatus Saccharibacteria bacterium]MBP9552395.1 DUF2797 domain-containing protein [Candidatus Saccharibacteria bacterium]
MNNDIFSRKSLILTRVDFDKSKRPRLKFADQITGEIMDFTPVYGNDITFTINTTKRYCIGWHDLKTGEDFACPEKAEIDPKYEQCPRCQKRTGFNPAFYNAADGDISQQQQIRNAQPHFVYLAYFAPNTIKVGISFVGRDITRLLEQGARSALILGEFSSANIARDYEAKISAMPGICENVKSNLKLKLLEQNYDSKIAERELLKTRSKIEQVLNITFDDYNVQSLDGFYSDQAIPSGNFISISDQFASSEEIIFSGKLIAQVGYVLIVSQQNESLTLPIKKYTGRKISLSPTLTDIELPERQASLFDF